MGPCAGNQLLYLLDTNRSSKGGAVYSPAITDFTFMVKVNCYNSLELL